MPLIYLGDQIFFQGSVNDFNTLSLYASLHAGSIRGLQLELRGNPPVFVPFDPTPDTLWLFYYDFVCAFEQLVPVIESELS